MAQNDVNSTRFAKEQQASTDQAFKDNERAAKELQARNVRAAAASGQKTIRDVETGRRTIATHPDGAPVYEAGPVKDAPMVPVSQTLAEKIAAGVTQAAPASNPLIPGDGALGAMGGTTATRLKQPVMDNRGNRSLADPITRTDAKTGVEYVSKPDPVTGQTAKVAVGVDQDAQAELAKKAEFQQRGSQIELRANAISQHRMRFDPRWKDVGDQYRKANAELDAFEKEPKFVLYGDERTGFAWRKRNPATGLPYFQQEDSKEANAQNTGPKFRKGDLVPTDPYEFSKWQKDHYELRSRHNAARKAHDALLPAATSLNAAEEKAKADRLQWASDRLKHELGISGDDGGSSSVLAQIETGIQSPEQKAAASIADLPADVAPAPGNSPESPDDSVPAAVQAAPAPAQRIIPTDDPNKAAVFSKAFSGLLKPEELATGESGDGYTFIRRNGENVGTVEKDKAGVAFVTISNGHQGDTLRGLVDMGTTAGIPVYLRDNPKGTRDTVAESKYVADVFAAMKVSPDEATATSQLQTMGATPDQLTRKVKSGQMSVQHAEALMKGIYQSTLKAEDPTKPEVFGKWLQQSAPREVREQWTAAKAAKDTEAENAVKKEFVNDWYAANRHKPTVTFQTRQDMEKALLGDLRTGEKVANFGKSAGEMGASSVGMLGMLTFGLGSLKLHSMMDDDPDAVTAWEDTKKNLGRGSANTRRGWELSRAKWFTDAGKEKMAAFEKAKVDLRRSVAAQDGFTDGINDPQWKAAYKKSIDAVTDSAYALHAMNLEEGWEMKREDLDPSANPALAQLVNGYAMGGDQSLLDGYFTALMEDHGTRQSQAYTADLTAGKGHYMAAMLAGSAAPPEEIGTEAVSWLLMAGVGKLLYGGAKTAQMAAKGSEAIAAAGAGSRVARMRLAMHGIRDEFKAAGMVTDTLANPASKLGRLSNKAVTFGKAAAAGASVEGPEEGVMALSDRNATAGSVVHDTIMGAVFGPIMAGATAIPSAITASANRQQASSKFAALYNRESAGTEGFIPLTPQKAEAAMALFDANSRETLLTQSRQAAANFATAIQAAKSPDAPAAALSAVSRAQEQLLKAGDTLANAAMTRAEAVQSIDTIPPENRDFAYAVAKVATGRPDLLTGAERSAAGARQTRDGKPYFTKVGGIDVVTDAGRAEALMDFPAVGALIQTSESQAILDFTQPASPDVQQPQTQAGDTSRESIAPQIPPQASPAEPGPAGMGAEATGGGGAPLEGTAGSPEPAAAGSVEEDDPFTPTAEDADALQAELEAELAGESNSGSNPPNPTSTEPNSGSGNNPGIIEAGNANDEVKAEAPQALAETAIERAKSRYPSLSARFNIDDVATGRSGGASASGATISIHRGDLQLELSGFEPAKQNERIDAILDEEIVHLAQFEAAKRMGEDVVDFYASLWTEFTPEQQAAASNTYQSDFDKQEPWQKAAETVRMLIQARADGKVTELTKAFSKNMPARLVEMLKHAVEFLKSAIEGGEVSKRIQDTIAGIEAILAEYSAETAAPETSGTLIDANGTKSEQANEQDPQGQAPGEEVAPSPVQVPPLPEGPQVIADAIPDSGDATGTGTAEAEREAQVAKPRRQIDSPARREAFALLREGETQFPILTKIIGSVGRITPPPANFGLIRAKRRKNQKLTPGEQATWDKFDAQYNGVLFQNELPDTKEGKIARAALSMVMARQGEGMDPDQAAQGINPAWTQDQLWTAIRSELGQMSRPRKTSADDPNRQTEPTADEVVKAETAAEKSQRQGADFDTSNTPGNGGQPLAVEDFTTDMEGQYVTVDGERMMIASVDWNSFLGHAEVVTLQDGTRFGRQVLEDGEVVYVEEAPSEEPRNAKVAKPEPKAEEPAVSEKGSTQINLPEKLAKRIRAFAASIPDSELYTEEEGYGREDEIHVTVLYGLTSDTAQQASEALERVGPITYRLGKTSLFENDSYDVLKIDVSGPDLHAANKALRESVDFENSYPDYQPHVTVAYLKKGEGAKYAGNAVFNGATVTSKEVLHSGKDRTKTPIALRPSTPQATAKPANPPQAPALTLETQTDEQIKAEAEAARQKAEIAKRHDKRLVGSAGDTTADIFGEGETPLFNERRDAPTSPASAGARSTEKPSKASAKGAGGESLPGIPEAPARIEDFGEKIVGARKDTWGKFKSAIDQELPEDVADITLSKYFPEPDYEAATANGLSADALATYKAIRDSIPAKPRRSYKLKGWAEMVRGIHPLMQKLASGSELTAPEYAAMNKLFYRGGDLADKINLYKDLGYPAFTKADDWKILDGVSILTENGVRLENPIVVTAALNKGRFVSGMTSKAKERAGYIEVLDMIRASIVKDMEAPAEKKAKPIEFSILTNRTSGDIFIGRKALNGWVRLKSGFKDPKEARQHLADNQAALEAQWEGLKKPVDYRKQVNAPREGPTRRDGDVTPELFQDTFGFRGVQFGNWVEGDRRQVDMNEAFDAFMDLADALGIPPKAVSLDGSLGLAFGARGIPNAKAHYEPGQVVINLTKKTGPGSLGHEWFHGFDNYFARLDSTGETKARPLDKFATNFSNAPKNMRPEVWEAFKQIRLALDSGPFAERSRKLDEVKSKPYYSQMIEKAARAFERYTVDRLKNKEISNDFLVNLSKDNSPALPNQDEMNSGIRQAFDHLFNVLDTKETDSGTMMFSSPAGGPISPETPIEVYDRQTGEVVWTGTYEKRDIAREVRDRRDIKYGGSRFAVRNSPQSESLSASRSRDTSTPDLFVAANAPDAQARLGGVKAGRLHALNAYKTLTAKKAKVGLTTAEEQQLLESETALGQKLAFDMDSVKGEAPAVVKESLTTPAPAFGSNRRTAQDEMSRAGEIDRKGQISLFASPGAKKADPLMTAIKALIEDPEKKAETFAKMNNMVNSVRKRFDNARLKAEFSRDGIDAQRYTQIRDVAILEAVAKSLPMEIRGKLVGSFRQLDMLKTAKGRENYLLKMLPKIESALEAHLQKLYRADIRKMIKRGSATASDNRTRGGKITAEGHDVFDKARAAMTMSAKGAEAEAVELQAKLESSELMELEEIDSLDAQINALELFHKYEDADSARLEKALEFLKEIYSEGRQKWLWELKERKDKRAVRVAKLAEALGYTGARAPRNNARRVDETLLTRLNEGLMGTTLSGSQIIRRLGEASNDPSVKALLEESEMAFTKAEGKEIDLNLADNVAFGEALKKILKVKSEFALTSKLKDLSTNDTGDAPVTSLEFRKVSEIKVPLSEVEALINREKSGFVPVNGKTAVVLTDAQRYELENQWERYNELLEEKQKGIRSLPVSVVEAAGERRSLGAITQLEGLNLLLIMRQPDQAEKLASMGYDAATFAELSDWLKPEVQQLGQWMVDYLAKDTAEVDKLHRTEKGVGLKLVDSYFPVRNDVASTDGSDIGLTGQAQQHTGRSLSFVKERVINSAEPLLGNALAVFLAHRAQVNFWKSHVEPMREWGGMFRDARFAAAVKSTMGDRYYKSLSDRIQRIEGGGKLKGGGVTALDRLVKALLRRFSMGTLGWRLSTFMVNATAALNAGLAIPAPQLIKGMARALKRPEAFKDAWNSPVIQRRLETGATFEAMLAKAKGPSIRPVSSSLERLAEPGVNAINYIDTAANVFGAAAVWEYTRTEAVKAGLPDAEARAMADDAAELLFLRASQPTMRLARSELELAALENPLSALFTLFLSEPRKNFALTYMAWREIFTGKGTQGKAMAAQTAVVSLGLLAAEEMIRGYFMALAKADDDDEDEITTRFIDNMTNPKRWAQIVTTNHMRGIPIVGGAWNAVSTQLVNMAPDALGEDVKLFSATQNPMERSAVQIGRAAGSLVGDDGMDTSAAIDLVQSFGSAFPGGPIFSQIANVAETGKGIYDSNASEAERIKRMKGRFNDFKKSLPSAKKTEDGPSDPKIERERDRRMIEFLKKETNGMDRESRKKFLKDIVVKDTVERMVRP